MKSDGGPRLGKARRGEVVLFRARCESLGFDCMEFVIGAHDSVPGPDGVPERVISVHRKQYDRDFRTLTPTGWVEEAVEALKSGHFGLP